jgi:homoserine kinase type II
MKEMYCEQCPNGCHLLFRWIDDQTVEIAGNKCQQGIVYASRHLRKTRKTHVVAKEDVPHFGKVTLKDIVHRWSQDLCSVHYHIPIVGSPERSLFRVVIETKEGFFLLEQVALRDLAKKKRIALVLDVLHHSGLSCLSTYCKDTRGDSIVEHQGGFWQISPFLSGVALNRKTYLYEKWRGEALASFLITFYSMSRNIPAFSVNEAFSLKQYILRLLSQIEERRPALVKDLAPIVEFLHREWMALCDHGPVAFCHGDYHPMNIIWGDRDIRGVIDWEFCGYKPEIYDAANLVGCVGIEHPSSLTGDLVVSFIQALRDARLFKDISWKYFLEYVIAVRFAWMSEWLRRDDHEMIAMELDYMNLLITRQSDLINVWGLELIMTNSSHS